MDMRQSAGKIDFLSYIGGFFDGEGYIGMGLQKTHLKIDGTYDRNILPSVRLSNTDIKPLEFIKNELSSAGIKCWISCRKGVRRNQKRTDGTAVKDLYDVGLSGKTQVKQFINLVRPYVFVKGEQMDIVMKFILSREKKMEGRGNRKGSGRAEYSDEEIALIDELKKLKH
jgi:hypothetical protein